MRMFARWQVLQALSHAVVKLLILKRKREMKDLWKLELKYVITSTITSTSTTITTIILIFLLLIIITMGTGYLSWR